MRDFAYQSVKAHRGAERGQTRKVAQKPEQDSQTEGAGLRDILRGKPKGSQHGQRGEEHPERERKRLPLTGIKMPVTFQNNLPHLLRFHEIHSATPPEESA